MEMTNRKVYCARNIRTKNWIYSSPWWEEKKEGPDFSKARIFKRKSDLTQAMGCINKNWRSAVEVVEFDLVEKR